MQFTDVMQEEAVGGDMWKGGDVWKGGGDVKEGMKEVEK